MANRNPVQIERKFNGGAAYYEVWDIVAGRVVGKHATIEEAVARWPRHIKMFGE